MCYTLCYVAVKVECAPRAGWRARTRAQTRGALAQSAFSPRRQRLPPVQRARPPRSAALGLCCRATAPRASSQSKARRAVAMHRRRQVRRTTIPPVLAMCAVCLPRASPPLSCSALRVRTLRRGDSQLAQFAGRRQDTRCAPNWSEHLEWPPPHSRSKTRRWARSNKAHPMPGLQAPAPSLLQVTRINPLTRHFDSTLSLDTLVGSTTL